MNEPRKGSTSYGVSPDVEIVVKSLQPSVLSQIYALKNILICLITPIVAIFLFFIGESPVSTDACSGRRALAVIRLPDILYLMLNGGCHGAYKNPLLLIEIVVYRYLFIYILSKTRVKHHQMLAAFFQIWKDILVKRRKLDKKPTKLLFDLSG